MNDKLKAFWGKLNTGIGTLWENNKIFVIVFGVLILIIKFREVIISFLVADSKRIFDNATKQSDSLKKQQDDYNSSANKLVEEAKQLPNHEGPVGTDWNVKK